MRQIRISLLALAAFCAFVFLLAGGCVSQQSHADSPVPAGTNAGFHLEPGPSDPHIAYVAALLLEYNHYLQRPLDAELSSRMFDEYINSLDSRHVHFLQSDMDEFEIYRTNLDKYITGGHGEADLTPAFKIFNRYVERYIQHTEFAQSLLKQKKSRFCTNQWFQIDRRHEPFPKDLAEAQSLWRQQLEYEFLYQHKLPDELTETNGNIVVNPNPTNAPDWIPALQRHYGWDLRQTTNCDSDIVMSAFLNALAHAYDPHSDYFSAPKAVDFSIQMSLSLFGIGAQLHEDDGYCTITSLVDGGPAKKSRQLHEKDRIIAVGQSNQPPVNVVDMDLEKVIQLIRGPKGTVVRLIISPDSDRASRKTLDLVRDEIKLDDAAARAKLVELPDDHGGTNRIGILDVPSFYATIAAHGNEGHAGKYTSDDVIKLVNRLKQEHVSGIIVDLRSNPGGSLEEAVRFSGLFIKDGPVVLQRNGDGQVRVRSDTDPSVLYDGPMEVMVNRFSASASEIAAAALQDYGRALIVGDSSTHGKGTVQNLNELKSLVTTDTNDPGTLKITISKFYRVTGASTQLKGVIPDIILPDPLSYSKQFGETALDYPLPWDTIQPYHIDALNLVRPYLGGLSSRSAARIATNQDFNYIRQDIAELQKRETEKSVALEEKKCIQERRENAARNKARDDERQARPLSPAKVYEITLEHLDQPLSSYHYDAEANHFVATTNELSKAAEETGTNAVPAKIAPFKNHTAGVDPALEEAEHILEDYISVLPRNGHLADGN